jgi:outer membrane protein insertion porin family
LLTAPAARIRAVPTPVPRRRFAVFLVLLLVSLAALADLVKISDIRVEGLQRIAPGTVFNYMPVQVGDTVGDDVTASIIRSLYQTGFFDDVRVERDGTVLVVSVKERPAIAEIDITGNSEIKEDDLKKGLKDIGLAEGRVFNRSVLDRIEQELKRQYFALGKYGVGIQSTVSPLERNRVAVRIEINEGLTARIKQINIIGNTAFDEKELLGQFKLGTSRWYSFYSKNDQYSKQKLAGDLEALGCDNMDRR